MLQAPNPKGAKTLADRGLDFEEAARYLGSVAFRSRRRELKSAPYVLVRNIPAGVRQALHVEAGDRVEFVEIEAGRFEVVAATRSVKELKGMFGSPPRTV